MSGSPLVEVTGLELHVSKHGVADVLDRAADELELNGHAKKSFGSASGPKCLVGALNFTLSGNTCTFGLPSNFWVEYVALEAVGREVSVESSFGQNLVAWNDAVDRLPFEVIDACRHAAKRLRADDDEYVVV